LSEAHCEAALQGNVLGNFVLHTPELQWSPEMQSESEVHDPSQLVPTHT
jgi:hypothetical protein